jgi:hypothetical protein
MPAGIAGTNWTRSDQHRFNFSAHFMHEIPVSKLERGEPFCVTHDAPRGGIYTVGLRLREAVPISFVIKLV